IPGWAFPIRILLRTLSSISLAVCLMIFVVLYATLASVPVGLLAQAPTWIFYALTLVIPLAIGVVLAALASSRLLASRSRAWRFPVMLGAMLATGTLVTWAWVSAVWPSLRWDRGTGEGVMFLADLVRTYDSTTVRRLPILEMTEIEFYSWWPLRAVLFLFIVNMIVATVRRIEFRLPFVGVLTVHTGIVVIGLGSMYYGTLKLEGDVLLRAGTPDEGGVPGPGPFEASFYDHQRTALHVRTFNSGWEIRPLRGVPRYNDYALDAGPTESAWTEIGVDTSFMDESKSRALDVAVPDGTLVPDLDFTIVGYCAYGELRQDWIEADPRSLTAVPHGASLRPMRVIGVNADMQDGKGERSVRRFALLPLEPAKRFEEFGGALSFEYTIGMDEARWQTLATACADALHTLVIDVPGSDGGRVTMPIVDSGERPIGETG
ncbi:MAG: hypothetical protein KDA28_16820, partial [Phycisphaerales bacterium]|nr:hypothetical protein [Phycisphaerales bacterium]